VSTPESNWDQVFETLRDARKRISLVLTGGGSGALKHCFRREGASRVFVEAVIPYSHAALMDYLGCPPSGSSASGSVAKQLASVALERARRLQDEHADSSQPVGIALVAALPTTPQRRGRDRIHVALLTQELLRSQRRGVLWSLELSKDAYTREQAESIADEMIRLALVELVESDQDKSFFRDAKLNLETIRFDA
jgi:hypothetical protein